MKRKDLLFLTHLRKNARETLTNISKKTDIPISTLYDKLKIHEKGLIKKHTTLIDFSKLGYNCRATITLKVDKENRNAMRESLLKSEHINSVFKINNGYDFMVECIFKNLKELEDFLDNLEDKYNIIEKQTYYIIEEIKREGFMTDPEIINILPTF